MGAGVGHARKMPLLTELENLLCLGSTKRPPLTGLVFAWVRSSAGDRAAGRLALPLPIVGAARVHCLQPKALGIAVGG